MLDPKDITQIKKLFEDNNNKLQTNLRKTIREEIEIESENLKSDLENRMLDHKVYLSGKIDAVGNKVRNVDVKTTKILKSHEKMDKFLDKEHMYTVKRVTHIEKHLGLDPLPNNY